MYRRTSIKLSFAKLTWPYHGFLFHPVSTCEDVPFQQLLGEGYTPVIYPSANMHMSPQYTTDDDYHHIWTTEYLSDECMKLERAVFLLIQEDFKFFVPVHHLFLTIKVGQQMCSTKIWHTVLENFPITSPLIRVKFQSPTITYMNSSTRISWRGFVKSKKYLATRNYVNPDIPMVRWTDGFNVPRRLNTVRLHHKRWQ